MQHPRFTVVTVVALLVLLPMIGRGQDPSPNCDFKKGAVDIDGCPEVKRDLERHDIAAKDPCNSSGALGQGECARRRLEAAERGGVRMWKSTKAVQCMARMTAERATELDRLRKDLIR
jgi:hypothetical protein